MIESIRGESLFSHKKLKSLYFIRVFYHIIRSVENGVPLPQYDNPVVQSLIQTVMENYNNLKGKNKKDWEDSLVAATNALRMGIDYRVNATNLVLVNIEYLQEDCNINALDFLLTLFRHQSVRGCNCYFMNKDLQLYLYSEKDDLFYPVLNTDYLYPVAFHLH